MSIYVYIYMILNLQIYIYRPCLLIEAPQWDPRLPHRGALGPWGPVAAWLWALEAPAADGPIIPRCWAHSLGFMMVKSPWLDDLGVT